MNVKYLNVDFASNDFFIFFQVGNTFGLTQCIYFMLHSGLYFVLYSVFILD